MSPQGCLSTYSYHRNSFPPQYQGINEAQLPGELFQEAVSVEYQLQQPVRAPPAFVLCLDLAQSPEALEVNMPLSSLPAYASHVHMTETLCCLIMQEMKQSIKQMLQLLPDYCLVGLLTYGAMVKGEARPCVPCYVPAGAATVQA